MICKYCGSQLADGKCPACGRAAVLRGRSAELDALIEAEADARSGRTYRQGLQEGYQRGLQEGYVKGAKEAAQRAEAAAKGATVAQPSGADRAAETPTAAVPALRGKPRAKGHAVHADRRTLLGFIAAVLALACVGGLAYRVGLRRGSAAILTAGVAPTEETTPTEAAEAAPAEEAEAAPAEAAEAAPAEAAEAAPAEEAEAAPTEAEAKRSPAPGEPPKDASQAAAQSESAAATGEQGNALAETDANTANSPSATPAGNADAASTRVDTSTEKNVVGEASAPISSAE